MNIPPTGRRVEVSRVSIIDVEDGPVVRGQYIWDLAGMLRHMRLLPEPSLHGRYTGELVALDLAPGLTPFFQWLTNAWMPWLGKTFNSSQQSGDNIFTKDSYPLARLHDRQRQDISRLCLPHIYRARSD